MANFTLAIVMHGLNNGLIHGTLPSVTVATRLCSLCSLSIPWRTQQPDSWHIAFRNSGHQALQPSQPFNTMDLKFNFFGYRGLA